MDWPLPVWSVSAGHRSRQTDTWGEGYRRGDDMDFMKGVCHSPGGTACGRPPAGSPTVYMDRRAGGQGGEAGRRRPAGRPV